MSSLPVINNEYEQLYKSYFGKLYNYGKKFTNEVFLIEDSIQEIFLDIWKRRKKNEQIINYPNSYYFTAFRYALFRKINQQLKHSLLFSDEVDPVFNAEQKIISFEKNNELNNEMQKALQALTSRQQEAIFLRFYEGLSYDEVAEVLGITVKSTYKIIARSLLGLKEKLSMSLVTILCFIMCTFNF